MRKSSPTIQSISTILVLAMFLNACANKNGSSGAPSGLAAANNSKTPGIETKISELEEKYKNLNPEEVGKSEALATAFFAVERNCSAETLAIGQNIISALRQEIKAAPSVEEQKALTEKNKPLVQKIERQRLVCFEEKSLEEISELIKKSNVTSIQFRTNKFLEKSPKCDENSFQLGKDLAKDILTSLVQETENLKSTEDESIQRQIHLGLYAPVKNWLRDCGVEIEKKLKEEEQRKKDYEELMKKVMAPSKLEAVKEKLSLRKAEKKFCEKNDIEEIKALMQEIPAALEDDMSRVIAADDAAVVGARHASLVSDFKLAIVACQEEIDAVQAEKDRQAKALQELVALEKKRLEEQRVKELQEQLEELARRHAREMAPFYLEGLKAELAKLEDSKKTKVCEISDLDSIKALLVKTPDAFATDLKNKATDDASAKKLNDDHKALLDRFDLALLSCQKEMDEETKAKEALAQKLRDQLEQEKKREFEKAKEAEQKYVELVASLQINRAQPLADQFVSGNASANEENLNAAISLLDILKKGKESDLNQALKAEDKERVRSQYDSLIQKLSDWIGKTQSKLAEEKRKVEEEKRRIEEEKRQQLEAQKRKEEEERKRKEEEQRYQQVISSQSLPGFKAAWDLFYKQGNQGQSEDALKYARELLDKMQIAKVQDAKLGLNTEDLAANVAGYEALQKTMNNWIRICAANVEAEKQRREAEYQKMLDTLNFVQLKSRSADVLSGAYVCTEDSLKSINDLLNQVPAQKAADLKNALRAADLENLQISYEQIISGLRAWTKKCDDKLDKERPAFLEFRGRPVRRLDLYGLKLTKNPETKQDQTILVPVLSVPARTKIKVDGKKFYRDVQYKDDTVVLTSNFYGTAQLLDSAAKAGVDADTLATLSKAGLYAKAEDLTDADEPRELELVSAKVVNIYTTKKMMYDRYNRMETTFVKLTSLPQGTKLRINLDEPVVKPLVLKGKVMDYEEQPFFRLKLDKANLAKLSADDREVLADTAGYAVITELGASKVVPALFNENLPKGIEKLDAKFRWDTYNPKGTWGHYIVSALEKPYNRFLLDNPPADIKEFCPAYKILPAEQRKIFWVSLVSEIANLESSFVPLNASDEGKISKKLDGVFSTGITQLSSGVMNSSCYVKRGCSQIQESFDLIDPKRHLSCAIAVMSCLAEAANCVSCTKIDPDTEKTIKLGIAAYWSTMSSKYTVPCDGSACNGREATTVGLKDDISSGIQESLPFCKLKPGQKLPEEPKTPAIRKPVQADDEPVTVRKPVSPSAKQNSEEAPRPKPSPTAKPRPVVKSDDEDAPPPPAKKEEPSGFTSFWNSLTKGGSSSSND